MGYSDQFYNMSNQLASLMPDKIKSYFTNDLRYISVQSEVYKLMKDWISIEGLSIPATPSLQQFIWFILSTSTTEETDTSKLRTRANNSRRDRKKYLYKIIGEEKNGTMKSQNPQYLLKNAQMYFELMQTNHDLPHYDKLEDYMEEQFEKITEWAKDSKYDISLFMFFDKIGEKRIAKCLEYDISFHVFDIIHNEYFDNPVDGYLFKTPRGAFDNNLFSMVSKDMPLDYEVTNSQVIAYSDYETKTKDGPKKIHTVVDSLSGDFKEAIAEGKQAELVRQLRMDNEITAYSKVLDPMDLHILNTIYSMFNVMDINRGTKKISLCDIVSASYSQTSKRTYLPTLNHIVKLASHKMDIIQETKDGKIRSGGKISFFDVMYQFTDENDEDQEMSSITITDANGNSELIERLKDYDLSKIILDIQPSVFLKESMKKQMNYSIMKNIYDKIAPVKAKSMLMYLQAVRTNIYPSTTTVIAFSTLEEQLHLGKLQKRELEKHIEEPIAMLKEEKIIVDNFTISQTAKTVTIEFFEFTDQEKYLYNIDTGTNYLGNSN